MGDPVFTSSQFAAFAAAIRHRESSDNYSDAKNPGYLGAYQMGISALGAGQQPIFPRRGVHVATGHRNDPIFIYENVNAGGNTGPTQGS